jgi:hypothetical protein
MNAIPDSSAFSARFAAAVRALQPQRNIVEHPQEHYQQTERNHNAHYGIGDV